MVHLEKTLAAKRAAENPDERLLKKQRDREYRVAARREKRNRKADAKKQRKLNATILRRMTRNPEKYTKNLSRNRQRAVDSERHLIQTNAIKQFQRLAAAHDPSGALFNVEPVVTLRDGTVMPAEELARRQEALKIQEEERLQEQTATGGEAMPTDEDYLMDPQRLLRVRLGPSNRDFEPQSWVSKSQQIRMAKLSEMESWNPERPVLPQGYNLPEGEENWLELWDLTDGDLERRVMQGKKAKQQERKALRQKQQSGKLDRRAARDEKRRVYRDLKMAWKLLKQEEKEYKTKVKEVENFESREIATAISNHNRQVAMAICKELGFTVKNTPGVDQIEPVIRGANKDKINLEEYEAAKAAFEKAKESGTQLQPSNSRRVDLSKAAQGEEIYFGPGSKALDNDETDFVQIDVGDETEFKATIYNHSTRRRIARAILSAEIEKESLVKQRAKEYLEKMGKPVPAELEASLKVENQKGSLLLENGQLETEKGERVRKRVELAEFNRHMKVLRSQAKELSLLAGLLVHAQRQGRITEEQALSMLDESKGFGEGWVKGDEWVQLQNKVARVEPRIAQNLEES